MRMLSWTSITVILVISVCCSTSSTPNRGQATSPPATEANQSEAAKAEESKSDANLVIIMGTLLKKDRTPLPNIELWIGSAEKRRGKLVAVKLEFYKGMMVMPGATTGPDGRFEIRMNRDFFKPGVEYAIAAKEDPVKGIGGGALSATFTIGPGAGRIDLGEIVSNL